MKKAILLLLLIPLLLIGCTKKSGSADAPTYQDGVYKGEYAHFDNHGWKPQLTITVDDGEISEVDWDYVNPAGSRKSEDQGYADFMESRSGTTPAKAKAELEEMLIDMQTADVDVVTGATHSSHAFQELAAAVLAQAVTGDRSMVSLPMNATYKAEEEEFGSHGWKATLSITFEDGEMVAADYQEVNEDGEIKAESSEYAEAMEPVSGTTPAAAKAELESRLLAAQSADIDAVTGATGSSSRFIALVEDIIAQR